jgi:hypothetical protein
MNAVAHWIPPSGSENETRPTSITAIAGAITPSIVCAPAERQPIRDDKVVELVVPGAEDDESFRLRPVYLLRG